MTKLRGEIMDSKLSLKSNERFAHLMKKHPCFNGEAHTNFGRIHLPVSPSCNIQCRFCQRSFNKWEDRPGVSRSLLTPKASLKVVERALELCPQITVAGIAGSGDTLATDHALETLELIHWKFPHLINCLSTNGLLLKEKANRIVSAGVKTVTVTVNSINPKGLSSICSHIISNGQFMTGEDAAQVLIEAQLSGIRKIVEQGVVVKINTVLIPGVNGESIGEVAKATAEAGASLINIIPLIPQHEMVLLRQPNCEELDSARISAEEFLPVFRHCLHCRADACGIPGSGIDYASELYEQPQETFSHG
jgi:nitrogen fixation protein NifB